MGRLTFFLALLHVYKALGEDRFWDTTIKLADTVTLECVHPLLFNLTQIEWFRVDTTKRESIAIFHPDYGEVIREPYVGRVDLVKSPSALNYRVLAIRNASEADVGFYSCLLDTFPHGSWEKVIQVVPSDHFETAVSPNSHVVSGTGENVTLTYELQTNRSMQQVTWEKIQARQIDLLTRCNLSQGKSNASRYRRQILSTCGQGMRRSTIVLPHVTASDSGLYRCLFQANTGENETFVFRLTVTDGDRKDSSVRSLRTQRVRCGGLEPKIEVSAGPLPSWDENLLHASLRATPGFWQFLAVLGSGPHPSSLCLCLHLAFFPVCVCLCNDTISTQGPIMKVWEAHKLGRDTIWPSTGHSIFMP
ncbi:CD226 antigen isoform X1 [Desmodus rotundus]|uniref:CD226 antigen isoform X1 n=1 Tax=Desmodus rotundus TaxID=9430 RepID=UPI001E1C1517|nr:CD226 antigen isoform X1 [Desmodus rotundus]XP_053769382.1 CD226 antigen isoform X1 [Desmodus rotundus]